MTPDESRQIEELARQMARDDGRDPDGTLRVWKCDLSGHISRKAWEYYVDIAAGQLGLVRDDD